MFRMDDTWIDENNVVEALHSMLGDKLWSHD